MKKVTGIAGILAPIVAVSLLAASGAWAGFALNAPVKTTGASLTATIVIDMTNDAGKGATSIRVQKAGVSTAAIFTSPYVVDLPWTQACTHPEYPDLQKSTAHFFTGFIDGLIQDLTIMDSLFLKFGIPAKAAIVDQDYVVCNVVGGRRVLSFTAVIQFDPTP